MKRTSLYLEEGQLKKLEAVSKKTGAPVAELIRRAIDAYLKAYPRKLARAERTGWKVLKTMGGE